MPDATKPRGAASSRSPQQSEPDRLVQDLADAREKLASLQALFDTFMEQSPFLSFVKNVDGQMVYYNRRFAERFGISMTAWLGKTDFDLFPTENARIYRENDLAVLRGGTMQMLEEPSAEADGTPSRWQVYRFPCAGADRATMLCGIAVDITTTLLREQKVNRLKSEVVHLRQQVEALTEIAVRERGAAMREHKEDLALAEV